MFRKLGWQLTASFVVVILFSMALLGFSLLPRVDALYTDDLKTSVHHEARIVSNQWAQYLENGPMTQLRKRFVLSQCRVISEGPGSRIRVLDSHGTVVIDTSGDNDPGLAQREEILRALQGEESITVIQPQQDVDPVRVAVAYPIKVWKPARGGPRFEIAGVVYVTRSQEYMRTVLHDLRFYFVAGTLLSLIVSGFLGILLSHLMSRPLRKIAAAADKMAKGDMTQMVRVRSRNEIGDLARSFNDMAAELHRRENELLEERNKLAAVITNMGGGVLMIDAQGRIVMKNRSSLQLLGVNEENPDDQSLAPLQDLIARALTSGSAGSQEIRLPHSKVAHVSWTPLRSEGDELLGFVIIMNDITELRRIDEMKTEFVSNVSHELRTPLASIKGLAEILLDGALEKEEGKRFLRSIDREIDRLTRLVKDLLDLSKIESGLVKFELRPVVVAELIDGVLTRMRPRFENGGLHPSVAADPACTALADTDRVEQVIINLLDNALRYTPAGGNIEIRVTGDGSSCTVQVENEGVGIPEADLSRIFERFYRVDKHRSRDQGGTGLGLSIARNIVERLGGRIWAESSGKVTTFTFTLPAPAEAPAEAARS